MKLNQKVSLRLSVLVVALVGIFGFVAQTRFASHAQSTQTSPTVYAVTTTNTLISFNAATPNTVTGNFPITGIGQGENILGIDFRPRTNKLYALSSASRIYTLNLTTGAATVVGTTAFTPALNGASFGFDFNPVPDRIRVTSDADQDLRLNPDTGALAAIDGTIAFNTGDANASANPNLVGIGYTNSFSGPTSTTLYGIDSNLDILVRQGSVGGAPDSPNNGKLNTIGPLGVDTTDQVGFDVVAPNDVAYASLTTQGASGSSFYSINLNTGAATLIGPIGGGSIIRDIAIPVTFIPTAQQAGFAVANAASFSIDTIAPDTIATIFGTFATANNQPATAMNVLPLPTSLGGVSVTINGIAAGLWYVSSSQINVWVPPGLADGLATFVITDANGATKTGQVSISRSAPGLFTVNANGTGSAVGFSTTDGSTFLPLSMNGTERALDPGTAANPNYLVLFGTGIRNAQAANPNDANGVAESVMATIQGIPATVTYAGKVPGLQGLDQLNIIIPPQLAGAGQVRVRGVVDGQASNFVTVTIGGTAAAVVTQPIAIGQFLGGALSSGDQVMRDESGRTFFFDAYRFTATSSSSVAIDVRSSVLDVVATLYKRNADGSLTPVAADDNLGGLGNGDVSNNNALLLTMLQQGGEYVLYVSSAQTAENGTGGYTVRLIGNVIQSIGFGSTINGTISSGDVQTSAGDYLDAYSFAGVAGDQVRITASSTAFDPLLILNSNNGDTLTADDNSGGGPTGKDAQITFTLPQTGIYVVIVTPFAPFTTGDYTLSINRTVTFGAALERETLSSLPGRAGRLSRILPDAGEVQIDSRFDRLTSRRLVVR